MDFLLLLQTHWPHVLAVTGPIAATVVFLSHVLQVRKLRYEVIKLQNENSERSRTIKLATTDEIEKYGNSGGYRFQVSSRVITICLALAFSGPILLVMRSVLQDINLNAPSPPEQEYGKVPERPPMEVPSPSMQVPSVVNINGSWRDPNNPYNGSQISQEGNSFQFNGWGVLPQGIPFESTGSGTITGQDIESTYITRYHNGWIAQGRCSGIVSLDGSRITSKCTDNVLGTFEILGVRQ